MSTPLICYKRAGDQRENNDQDDALFVLREIENSEQALHLIVAQLWYLWDITFLRLGTAKLSF
jgi:hypothetical protein